MENTTESNIYQCIVDSDRLLLICVAAVILAFGFTSNLIAILTIIISKKIRLHGQGLIIGITLSDLLFVGFYFPVIIVVVANCSRWPAGERMCELQGYIGMLSAHLSINNICFVGIIRYLSIAHIGVYRNISNRSTMITGMSITWVISAIVPILALAGWDRIHFDDLVDTCIYDWKYNTDFTMFIAILAFITPIGITVVCYVGIFIEFSRSRRRVSAAPPVRICMTSDSSAVSPHDVTRSTNQTVGRDKKGSKMKLHLAFQLLALLITFIVSWGPYFILAWVIDIEGERPKNVYDVTSNFIVAHTFLNPIVYFFFNELFRKEAWMLVRCRLNK